ncbi:MAG: ribosomal protein S18-alanine N-acetyltransferase [Vicinamibacteria bacterium]|nr:ribosomal protein S18-alanine N-acetyltransferase [Vicinamibacteria bacterium]
MNQGTDDGPVFGPASPHDIAAIAAIETGSPQAWPAQAFEAELPHDPPTLFVLRASGRVVAFVVARVQPPEMDIVNIGVETNHRRRGLGRIVVRSLLDEARRAGVSNAFLEVREGNEAARQLYRNCGFAETQKRRGFYRNPTEDAVLMACKIEP